MVETCLLSACAREGSRRGVCTGKYCSTSILHHGTAQFTTVQGEETCVTGEHRNVAWCPLTSNGTHARTHAHTCMHTRTHLHAHTHAHTHTRTHLHAHTHTPACTHAHTCMHTRTHLHAHTHAHTHTRTHLHAHMHTPACTHARAPECSSAYKYTQKHKKYLCPCCCSPCR